MNPSRSMASVLRISLWLLVMNVATAAQSPPDLAGTWFPARFSAGAPALPPGPGFMREPGPPVFEFARGDFGGLQLQDAALQSARRWQPAEPTLAAACAPASILQAMTSPFPFEAIPGTQLLVIRLEYFDLVRLVYMDGRRHPGPDYPHTKTGYSTGKWQAGVLVIDTTHLSPSVITTNGVAHTQDVHVVERLRLDADGRTLHYIQEFEDPMVLKLPGRRYAQFTRRADNLTPYECDPGYAELIQQRGGRMSAADTQLVSTLLEDARRAQQAWVTGDSTVYAEELMSHTERFSIFAPFGGPSPPGWSDRIAQIQAGTAKAFQGGSSSIDLVQSHVSDDLAVLVMIERNEVKFAGHDKPLPWNLRTTQVYGRDTAGHWKVVHRHADPLLLPRDLDQTLQLMER